METLSFSRYEVAEIAAHYSALSTKVPLHAITTAAGHRRAVRALDALLDAGAADEAHELAPLADALGELIGEYEDAHHDLPQGSPADALRELMSQHQLRQGDLPEIGSQGVVSEILSGKRELNVRQMRALARRFGVAPAVFFPA